MSDFDFIGRTGVAGLKYQYLTDVSATPPAAGKVKFDTVDLGEALTLQVANTDRDGNDVYEFLSAWDKSTTEDIKAHVFLRDKAGKMAIFKIVEGHDVQLGTVDAADFDGGIPAGGSSVGVQSGVQHNGKIIIGGSFTMAGGVARNRIARFHKNGTLDTTFDPDCDGPVYLIAIDSEDRIYVGGDFTTIAGTARNKIARLNADGTIDPAWDPNADGVVFGLAFYDKDSVILVGDFNNMGGQPRSGVARMMSDDTLDPDFAPVVGGQVRCVIAQGDGKIILGGGFSSVNGEARSKLARISADGGVTDSWDPTLPDTLFDYCNAMLLLPDGNVVVAGEFTNAGSAAHDAIAVIDSVTGLATSFDAGAITFHGSRPTIHGLAFADDGDILVAGSFSDVAGLTRNCVAKLNPTTGAVSDFDGGLLPFGALEATLGNAVAVQGDDKIIVIGDFDEAGGEIRAGIARYAGSYHEFQIQWVSGAVDFDNETIVRIEWYRTGDQPDFGYTPENVANKVTDFDAPNDVEYPTTQAVETRIAAIIAAQDAMIFKGVINASSNPNYPAADAGWTYRISVAGRIGGGAGPRVEVGDTLLCLVDGSGSNDHAGIGANWNISQSNIDGAVVGPTSATDGALALFDGTSGKLIKNGVVGTGEQVLRYAAGVLGFGTIATAGIANQAVTYIKMQQTAAGFCVLGRPTGAGQIVELGPATAGQILVQDGISSLGFSTTLKGVYTLTPPVRTSGALSYFTLNMPLDTGITATNESIGVNFAAGTRTWADGTTNLQRERVFGAPTYNRTGAGATAFTTAVNVDIADPVFGSGVTGTLYGLRVNRSLHTGFTRFALNGTNGLEITPNWNGTAVWLDITTTGPSGIGSGGPGGSCWIGYVASGGPGGNWFGNSTTGDIAFRNSTSGKALLFGNSSSVFTFEVRNDILTMGDGRNIAFNTGTGTIIGTAAAQKLAFWGLAPIVQPTTAFTASSFTANAGTAINDASTFDGYTLKQIVRAIRTIGLLA